MKNKMLFVLLVLYSLILAVNTMQFSAVNANSGDPSEFTENINVFVNCTTAVVSIQSMVMSSDVSLLNFTAEVDMSRTELENATTIALVFSQAQSVLVFAFNNTDESTAHSNADAVKDSIETAFETSFTFNSTGTSDSYVNVTYTGSDKTDLADYTEDLMQKCLASNLGGFSLTFVPLAQKTGALVSVGANKESGGFDWMYYMGVGYSTSIPTGTGNHTIEILELLNVDSLAPSQYAAIEIGYSSMVMLTVSSNETITYVSCEPGEISPPEQLRGWFINPKSGTSLMAYFSFGSDSSPVSPLSFTFNGNVVPEFTALTLMAMLVLAATLVLMVKKQKVLK
ncbi:MAG: hypothetical protein QW270_01040 [Candidatus Bathyarchaeia archaeon]